MARPQGRARKFLAATGRRVRGSKARPTLPAPVPPRPQTWLERATASSWELTRDDVRLLRAVDAAVEGRTKPRAAIVTDDLSGPLAMLAPGRNVHTTDTDPGELTLELARVARYDVIVLDTADAVHRRALMLRLFPLTKVGGRFIVARLSDGAGSESPELVRTLAELLEPNEESARKLGLRKKDLPELRRAVDAVELAGNHAVLTNRTRAYAKLYEREANLMLERTEGRRGRVVMKRDGGEFVPSAPRSESESPLADSWRKKYDVPDLFLREYRNVVCTPGQVVTQGATILPDTFRHIGGPHAGNSYAPDLNRQFARLADRRRPQRVLAEPHFYYDSQFRGHFGHAMTEQLSRLWAIAEAKQRYPDLRVFMAMNRNRELADFEVELLEPFGVTRADITFVHEPVRVRTLLAATPMFSQPRYVHPGIAEVWERLGSTLASRGPGREYPKRMFVGRRIQKRACRNAAEVEALFAAYGFEIVYPEEHSLPEQARMFREAEVIGGYAGSGLFNVLFADQPKHLILVASESYTAENEWMIAAVRNHRVDVAWCEAEQKMAKGGPFIRSAFHSPFSFNVEREGVFLTKVLNDLV